MATHIGGLVGFLATEMRFEFLDPVYVGDTITGRAAGKPRTFMPGRKRRFSLLHTHIRHHGQRAGNSDG
jgi:acyl dehydratase